MPHARIRHIELVLNKLLKFSPVVGVFGHRQVGKTWLLENLEKRDYVTFDKIQDFERFSLSPEEQLLSALKKPLSIDECQKVDALFPAIKDFVRLHKRPGLILLSGSVKFHAKKSIRESLTGRMMTIELAPFTISEIKKTKPNFTLLKLLDHNWPDESSTQAIPEKYILDFFKSGGLPGVLFTRDQGLKMQQHASMIETIIERDLKLIEPTTLGLESILNFLIQLSKMTNTDFTIKNLSLRTRISIPTIKKLLRSFEALYILRTLNNDGNSGKQRYFFEDIGELQHLNSGQSSYRDLCTHALFHQARVLRGLKPESYIQVSYYQNRGGAEIPLVIKQKNAAIGIIPLETQGPTPQAIGSAQSFLKKNSHHKVIFCPLNGAIKSVSERMKVMPLTYLL
jgi:predicted AAA+ superfamily ATPase